MSIARDPVDGRVSAFVSIKKLYSHSVLLPRDGRVPTNFFPYYVLRNISHRSNRTSILLSGQGKRRGLK